jgi:hypothetical protein
MKIPCFSKDWHQHIYKPFLEPKIVKMQCQNAKTTEPETIIFLEAQGEQLLHYSLCMIDSSAIFKI